MVAREQYIRDLLVFPDARAGEVRCIKQGSTGLIAQAEGVLLGGVLVSKYARKKPGDGVDEYECREFASTEHIVADAEFQRGEGLDDPLVNAFIVPGNQKNSFFIRQRFDRGLRGSPSLRCEQNSLRTPWIHSFYCQYCVVQWLAHQHHARPAAKGPIIDLVVLVSAPVTNVVNVGLNKSGLMSPSEDARLERS